jgi:flagellar motor switch protein FliM
MSAAFDPLAPVTFNLDRIETNPRFAVIARGANAGLLVRFRIDMEDRGGKLELILPYATLEPIRELLLQMFMGEKFGRDSIWEGHLATELWSTKLDIDAVLDQQVMSLREVRNFQVGQTLLLNAEPQSEVELRSGNVPLFKGRMGRKNNKIAVQVDRLLSRHERNGQAG